VAEDSRGLENREGKGDLTMRKRLAAAAGVSALGLALAAVWGPGRWWQWVISSALMVVTAAVLDA
jgi:hypothetical protein